MSIGAPDMSDWAPDADGQFRVEMDGVIAVVRQLAPPGLWTWQVYSSQRVARHALYTANGTCRSADAAKAAALAVMQAAIYANGL